MDSYADHPKSIGELRADRTGSCRDWTPRDALIEVLRMLDKGEIKPTALIVAHMELSDDGTGKADYHVASPNMGLTLGLLARTAYRVNLNNDQQA